MRCEGGFWDFLTESERSGERLPRAAHRVSESESINRVYRISEFFNRMTGFSGWTVWRRLMSLRRFFRFKVCVPS